MVRALCTLSCVFLVQGCDCAGPEGHDPNGLCAMPDPPASCGQDCVGAEPCPAGFYCTGEGVCSQDCDSLRPETCAGGVCSDEGRCSAFLRDGSADATGVCADVRVQASRVTPTVVFVIDQSGSMDEDFGSTDRWNALRDSLLATPDGFIAALEAQVRFGVALYTADFEDGMLIGMCPAIQWVPPARNNFAAINALYGDMAQVPTGDTPTGESLDAVLDRLTMTPDPSADPTILILATDGEPDTCAVPNPQTGQPESLAAVERAYRAGVRTFIISVGRDVSLGHMQEMANAGVGVMTGDPDAPFYVAGDDAGLRSALRAIIGGELNCVVTLSGEIQDLDRACSGRVILNGTPLSCDDPNGWRAIDATHIELVGDACELLLSVPDATLEASFPCDVVLI